jgi:hypothetical protein
VLGTLAGEATGVDEATARAVVATRVTAGTVVAVTTAALGDGVVAGMATGVGVLRDGALVAGTAVAGTAVGETEAPAQAINSNDPRLHAARIPPLALPRAPSILTLLPSL